MNYRCIITIIFLAFAPFTITFAQSPLSDRIDRLEGMIKVLQQELTRTRSQLDEVMSEKNNQAKNSAVRTDEENITISTTGGGISIKSDNGNSFKFSGRIMMDYDFFNDVFTDDGESKSEGEFRRTRLTASGSVKNDWLYKFTVNIDDQDETSDMNTAYIEYVGFDPISLKAGKFSEPFSLERSSSSKWLSTIERNILLDFLSGNLGAGEANFAGLQISGLHEEMNNFSWAVGIFDDGAEDLDGSDNYAVTGRVAISPHFGENHFVHLGAAYSTRDIEGVVKYRSRLGVHTAKNLTFAESWVDDVEQFGLELAYANGPFSLQGEYIDASADGAIPKGHETLEDNDSDGADDRLSGQRPEGACHDDKQFVACKDIDFDGYYLQASYILTGENRSYDAKKASFGRINPGSSIGAWELVARYEEADIDNDNADVDDRRKVDVEKWVLGMNWYANKSVKFMLNYINAEVDEALAQGDGTDNDGDTVSFRAQYTF